MSDDPKRYSFDDILDAIIRTSGGRLLTPEEAKTLDDKEKLVADRLVALWEKMQKRTAKPRRRPFSLSGDPRMWWGGLPMVGGRQPVVTKDRMRWRLVCVLHDEFELTWDETFSHATEIFAGTFWRGGIETMKRAYKKIERSLPAEERRTAERRGKRRLPLG
jgi:hypothetical protein